jgi:prolipoprotein diacylglyceryltransferase
MLHSTNGPLAHTLLEALAYFCAARLYWRQARRQLQPPARVDRWLLLGCVIFGSALGSKSLHVLEHWNALHESGDLRGWFGGKSVLGGLMGGTLGAELGKKLIGWTHSTGDAWVTPLTVGLIIGRLGCQLSGIWDETYGIPTSLPWGWDYGDGIPRHPTGLYEIFAVFILWAGTRGRWGTSSGTRFAAFLLGYCLLRLSIDFLKPPFGAAAAGSLPVTLFEGLTAIQWTALVGVASYSLLLRHRAAPRLQPTP